MRKLLYLLPAVWLFCGCTASAVRQISLAQDGHCDFVESHNFWGSGTAIPCFDKNGKLMGFGQSNGTSPAVMWSSAANAAVIAGAFSGAAALGGSSSAAAAVK